MSDAAEAFLAKKSMMRYEEKGRLIPTPKTYTEAVKVAKDLFPALRHTRIQFKTGPLARFGNQSADITPELYREMVGYDAVTVLNICVADLPNLPSLSSASPRKFHAKVKSLSPELEPSPEPSSDEDDNGGGSTSRRTLSSTLVKRTSRRVSVKTSKVARKSVPISPPNNRRGPKVYGFLELRVPVVGGWQAIETTVGSPDVAQLLRDTTKQFLLSMRDVNLPLVGALDRRKDYLRLAERYKDHIKTVPGLSRLPTQLQRVKPQAEQQSRGMIAMDYGATLFMLLHTVSWRLPPRRHKRNEKEREQIDLTSDNEDCTGGSGDGDAKTEHESD